MENLNISFFSSVLDRVGCSMPLYKVLDLIREGGNQSVLISSLRRAVAEGQDSAIPVLKQQLPGAIFSCEMDGKGRKEENIKHLYPLICLDFDAKDNPALDLPTEGKKLLSQNPHVLSAFVSPSGLGLKVLFCISDIKGSKSLYKEAYRSVEDFFRLYYSLKIDPHSSSPVALDFLSYDSDLYINPGAIPFDYVAFSRPLDLSGRTVTRSSNKVISRDLSLDNVSNKVDSYDAWLRVGLGLANEYGEAGREIFHRISEQSKGYAPQDCDRKYDNLLSSSRGQIGLGTLKRILEDNPKKPKRAKNKKSAKQANEEALEGDQVWELADYLARFGFFDYKKSRSGHFRFRQTEFLELAEKLGLYSWNQGAISSVVHISDGLIYLLEDWQIIKIISDYIKEHMPFEEITVLNDDKEYVINKKDLINSVFHWKTEILHKITLQNLPEFPQCRLLKSDANTCYRFYRNGVIALSRVTKAKEFRPYTAYAESGRYVFAHEILQRDYLEGDYLESETYKFVQNISGTAERAKWCSMLLGYLCYSYIDSNEKQKVVIFSDAQNSGGEAGRTGKGLLNKMVKHQYFTPSADSARFEQVTLIDGKNFRSENKFKYQNCSLTTKLILLEDIEPYHRLQQHFNELFDGFSVEQKNSKPFRIFAKLSISTNHSVEIEDKSSRDRFWEFPLLPYYSDRHRPFDDFGSIFFSSNWSSAQWANYDAFMHYCVLEYFRAFDEYNGNIPQLADDSNMDKKLEDLVGIEFLDWADNLENPDGTIGLQEGIRYYRRDLYDSFCGFYPKYKISAKLFLNKVRQFKKYHPGFEEDTIDKNGNWSQEGRDSLSGRYIVFIKKPKVE